MHPLRIFYRLFNVSLVGDVSFVKLCTEYVTHITLPYGKLRYVMTYE